MAKAPCSPNGADSLLLHIHYAASPIFDTLIGSPPPAKFGTERNILGMRPSTDPRQPLTSPSISGWLETFLACRGVERPDGRALYAYRCTSEEFGSLAGALSWDPPQGGSASHMPIRAFVLYAAEWWQREYDGRHWAWEPLLESIGWGGVHYPDLYEPVRRAWGWWKVDLVRLPTSVRYLGTFACQGGLPLALVGHGQKSVTRYLRAVLKHTSAYRRFVDDPIDLARDQQHLLRPPTLCRDHVFRLAADLIEAVLDLQDDAQDEDPINTLDRTRPDWRRTMPLDLEDERARDLLAGLLREAGRDRTSTAGDFRVERFLRRTGIGWRLGARVRLPASISVDVLARQLGVRTDELPPRLQACTGGESNRVIGLYAARSDDFLLARDTRGPPEFWDTEAAGEVRLRFRAGDPIGEPVLPYRGGALGELPWAFRVGDDYEFTGEGSVANRSPELLVLVPDGCAPDRGEPITEPLAPGSEGLGRALWKVSERAAIETEIGRCVITPSSGQATEEEYRLSGRRFHGLESAWPLFRGRPTLRLAKAEQPARAVPAGEVGWRQAGGDWQPRPTGSGLWEVRHVRAGELRHLGRAGVLPEQFDCSIEPGPDMNQGHLMLTGGEHARVAGYDPDTVVTARTEGDDVRVQVAAKDAVAPPVRVKLRLHWPGAAELVVEAPFPGQGGRILREGKPLERGLAVDELYGVRAMALSPDRTQKFRIEGELKAEDLGDLVRVAWFHCPLLKSGVTHELPLIDLRARIDLLLSASSSSDARVDLRIEDESQKRHHTARVSRFAAALECEPDRSRVSVSTAVIDDHVPTFEAMPLARPGDDPVLLDPIGPTNAPSGAVLPHDLNLDEPWLVAMRHGERVRARPVRIGGPIQSGACSGLEGSRAPRLAEALGITESEQRTQEIAEVMDDMLKAEDPESGEEEWSFLTESLLRAEGLPATALDLCRVLVTKPRLLVQSLFRLESAPRQLLWRLEGELPFSWLLIRRKVWWNEAKRAFDRLHGELAGVNDRDRIACEHVEKILDEGADQLPALDTVFTDVAMRLEGGHLSDDFFQKLEEEWKRQTTEQVQLRASLDDWPRGDGRREWTKELENGEALGQLFGKWQNPEEHRNRQPIFDTPIAAAWCCYFSKPTDRTVFLVKHIRAHDLEWFDLAYRAAWFRLARMQDDSRKKR